MPGPEHHEFKLKIQAACKFMADVYMTRAVLLPNNHLRVVLACWEPHAVRPAVLRGLTPVVKKITIPLPADQMNTNWNVEFFVMGPDLIKEISDEKGLMYYKKEFSDTSVSKVIGLGKKIYSVDSEPGGTVLLTDKDEAMFTSQLINYWFNRLADEYHAKFDYQYANWSMTLGRECFKDEMENLTEANIAKVSDEMLNHVSNVCSLLRTLKRELKLGQLTPLMVDRIKEKLSIGLITSEVEPWVIKELDARKKQEPAPELPPEHEPEPEPESKNLPVPEQPIEVPQPQSKPTPASASSVSFWNHRKTLLVAATAAAVVVAGYLNP